MLETGFQQLAAANGRAAVVLRVGSVRCSLPSLYCVLFYLFIYLFIYLLFAVFDSLALSLLFFLPSIDESASALLALSNPL
jgi:hypothetical protein